MNGNENADRIHALSHEDHRRAILAGDFRHIPNAAELDHQERVARFYGDDRPTLRQLIDERRVEPAETVECLRFLKAMAEDPDVAEAFREILATNRLANA